MRRTTWGIATAGLAAALMAGTASAQETSAQELEKMRAQLAQLQRQVETLRGRVNEQERRPLYAPIKAKAPKDPIVVMTSGNRPGICSPDKFNCIYITGRLHLDFGGYDWRPSAALPAGDQNAHNGVNARRMRIGLTGTFIRDWNWTLVGEFGGSEDITGNAQINNAFITYKGFGKTWIEAGYMDVPYTLDEQLGSNNILFMERATPQVLAVDIAAGDNRSAFGFRTFGKSHWFGSYLTGPSIGQDHDERVSVGLTARGVFVPVRNDDFTWLVEGDYLRLITPAVSDQLRMRDRPEVRIDPGLRILDTGVLANVESADVLSGGTAFAYRNLYFQGEYFNYNLQRTVGGDLSFNGGYVQAAYTLTGEARRYSESNGAFGGINPKRPFLMGSDGWGAWELALRYSHADLNDTDVAAPVRGGVQRNVTAGINWYPNQNIRFMFNWIHGEVEKFDAVGTNLSADYDVFAGRMQLTF
ncbi:MAG: hypothetical protein KIT15_15590 [Xanthobacteraceae bacterium]|nr:hypothetical protein [Xanthobacteraceae bacterium]MCW5675998.1 hypothetical protein [Xanthobacteraceae bacterium]